MNEIRNLMVGIDFRRDVTQLCYYDRKAEEPLSVSMKAGSEQYEAPTLLTRRTQGDYVVGVEAEYFASEKNGERVPDVYDIASAEENEKISVGEEEIPAVELLAAYLKGVLHFLGVINLKKSVSCITVTTESLTSDMVRNLSDAMEYLGFTEDQFMLIDQEEAFYYYVATQKKEVLNRSIGWYIFEENHVSFRKLTVEFNARPVYVRLHTGPETLLGNESRDQDFCSFIDETLGRELFASVQLSGHGFSQDWAVESVKKLCFQRRKVFFGNNLFARGACAAAKEKKENHRLKHYRFISAALVEKDIGMDMRVMGAPAYYPLIEGGKNWYECHGECELILDDADQLVFLVTTAGESEKKRVAMQLPGLPVRPAKTTRLHLSLQYESAKKCRITVRDLGFGEMYPSSGKIWKEIVEW